MIESTSFTSLALLLFLKSFITRHSLVVVWMVQFFKIRMSKRAILAILAILWIGTVIWNVCKRVWTPPVVLQLMSIETNAPIMSFILIGTELSLEFTHVELTFVIFTIFISLN
jgi:hypothetical protein